MLRRLLGAGCGAAALLVGLSGAGSGAAASTPLSLVLSQSSAFAALGYSCGGIAEQAYASGFDPTTGYPQGDVHLQTTCNGSGRGGRSTTYTAWASVTWDYTGATVTDAKLSSAPSLDPTFSATDSYGNQLYDSASQAYLLLAPSFVPPPRITSISLRAGPASGGSSVTITGDGFTGASAVDFGSTPATNFTVSGDTSITAITPAAAASTVDITVANAGGTSATSAGDQFTFVAQPLVSGLTPNAGPVSGGTTVTISGANFTDATSVTIGDNPVGFTIDSDSAITMVTPPLDSPDSESVTVSSLGGTSVTGHASTFTYEAAPQLSVSPKSGPPATVVTMSGFGFKPGETVKARYKTGKTLPAWLTLCSGTADASGAVSCSGLIPKAASAGALGTHIVQATGSKSHLVLAATFTLT